MPGVALAYRSMHAFLHRSLKLRQFTKSFSYLILLGLTVMGLCASVFAQTDPIDEQLFRLKQKIAIAEARLMAEPGSKQLRRDLADELHRLAHLEEERKNFVSAIELHQQSLNLYILSGERTRSSWDDGIQHTFEHLFMAHFDQAKLEQTTNRFSSAHRWYLAAFELFVLYPRVFAETNNLGRVRKRVQEFERLAPHSLKRIVYKLLGDASSVPLLTYTTYVQSKVQCIELF